MPITTTCYKKPFTKGLNWVQIIFFPFLSSAEVSITRSFLNEIDRKVSANIILLYTCVHALNTSHLTFTWYAATFKNVSDFSAKIISQATISNDDFNRFSGLDSTIFSKITQRNAIHWCQITHIPIIPS